jgi:hypothetical protein
MEQTQKNRLIKQVQTNIDLAEQALLVDKLDEAQKYFDEALHVEGDHPERASQIRQMLKHYSDELTDQASPNWELAHQALAMIEALKLQDEQTQGWQRDLKLKEAQYRLDQNDLDSSFTIFGNLINEAQGSDLQSELRHDISQLVRDHVEQRVPEQQWSRLREVIERLKDLLVPTDEIHNWLEVISTILTAVSDEEQAQRRHRSWNYALGGLIALLLVVAYWVGIFNLLLP